MSQPPLSFQDALIADMITRFERFTAKIIAARLHLEQTGECSLYFVQRPAPEGVLLTLPPLPSREQSLVHQDSWDLPNEALPGDRHQWFPASSRLPHLVRHTRNALYHCQLPITAATNHPTL